VACWHPSFFFPESSVLAPDLSLLYFFPFPSSFNTGKEEVSGRDLFPFRRAQSFPFLFFWPQAWLADDRGWRRRGALPSFFFFFSHTSPDGGPFFFFFFSLHPAVGEGEDMLGNGSFIFPSFPFFFRRIPRRGLDFPSASTGFFFISFFPTR